MKVLLAVVACLLIGGCAPCLASGNKVLPDQIDFNRLADAIYKAEGGAKTAHPYGIMTRYKHTTPRQACINTLKHRWAEFSVSSPNADSRAIGPFLAYVQRSYAPIGAQNDPSNLNRYWKTNVEAFYNKGAI